MRDVDLSAERLTCIIIAHIWIVGAMIVEDDFTFLVMTGIGVGFTLFGFLLMILERIINNKVEHK